MCSWGTAPVLPAVRRVRFSRGSPKWRTSSALESGQGPEDEVRRTVTKLSSVARVCRSDLLIREREIDRERNQPYDEHAIR